MEEYELDAWLGDTEVTDEQRAALHRASDMCAARYGADLEDDRTLAFNAAAQVILGDDTLDAYSVAYAQARRAERDAMASLTGAIIASSADMSEVAISTSTGITRMTVRKALGK
ncbi:hypothetical protein [Microbacterium terrisoli]|uniref:hypothetical protein n=1 Tax=Microbacterium terrisoli TaxID=3242192 RepID=UPI0028051EA9|nr:hypothetical protein [Microbacterium protaetiae]